MAAPPKSALNPNEMVLPSNLVVPALKENAHVPDEGIRMGSITGYRLWRTDGHRLFSVTRPTLWLPGVAMTGDVDKKEEFGPHHGVYAFSDSAAASCEFGHYPVHLFNRYNPNIRLNGVVLGTVKMWGRIVEHERGFRAENAKIASIDVILFDERFDRIGGYHMIVIDILRSLYIDHQVPGGLTPVLDPNYKLAGVTTLTRSRPDVPYVAILESPVVSDINAPINASIHYYAFERMTNNDTREKRDAVVLGRGQDPSHLPGWLSIGERP